MSISTREERFVRRIEGLYANDAQFTAAMPNVAIATAAEQLGLGLRQIIQIVMNGYAERPALGQRASQLVTDPSTGRTSRQLLPRFETITYRELSEQADALASALAVAPAVQPGDRVCMLGFTSIDYTTIDMALIQLGAVAVPLQASGAIARLQSIVAETEPTAIAASIDNLADAVELVLTGHVPARLIVFDYYPEVDDQREVVEAARTRLAGASVVIETLTDAIRRGKTITPAPTALVDTSADRLALLTYTSGSTGAPKGAMFPESALVNFWRNSTAWFESGGAPSITLNYMPMSHVVGRQIVYGTLSNGGIAYFVAKSDLSTLFEDLSLVRPTELYFVPRVWDMLFDTFQSQFDRRSLGRHDLEIVEAEVKAEVRDNILGGRFVLAMTSSAPISEEMKAWVEDLLQDVHLMEGYGCTEAGTILIDGQIQRPAVLDYKLVDVPELGYFLTDQPYPRGELLVKTQSLFPGYYKRQEATVAVFDANGFYRTGDVMAQVGPEQFVCLDRRNNVQKLSQGEFVTVAKLELLFGNSPLVQHVYVYGNSARAYLLAVIVPTQEALERFDVGELKRRIAESLQKIAKAADLESYEIPRDFIIDTTPWTPENGLLTGSGKVARPQLKQYYSERLEQRYADLEQSQTNELRALRQNSADAPVLDTVKRAAGALLSTAVASIQADTHFTDLGGDSLSALSFANLLHEIFDVDVQVGVIVSPASDLQALADYIEGERQGTKRPSFASVHGRDAMEVYASDLTLDKFIDAATLVQAPSLPAPSGQVLTVLLTGATGFLGRYLALDWLERMDLVDGKVIALVRAKSDEDARARLDKVFNSGDQKLLAHYQELAVDHLEVIAGDKGKANLGLDQQVWQRLADTVDLIVDPAALVNHVLPYSQLFEPNVLGTAELIRLALTTKQKPYIYTSTISVGNQVAPADFTEDADIRVISATRQINESYANGYGNAKWAGEVLLRQAHDLCGLPITVCRCDMILAGTTYAGQLNTPDMFTRMILSLVATGIAPSSFYELDAEGNRQRAHYDGLPVEFIAEAISTLGAQNADGSRVYHVMNPYDDGIGMDEFVDWLIDDGASIRRIADYGDWLQRFETSLRGLPEKQRNSSMLPLLHNYQKPEKPINGSMAPTDQFHAAVRNMQIGPDNDIPHISPSIITKYVSDLRLLGLL